MILYVKISKNTLQDHLDPAWCKKVLQPEDTCPKYKNLYHTERQKIEDVCNMKRSSMYALRQMAK